MEPYSEIVVADMQRAGILSIREAGNVGRTVICYPTRVGENLKVVINYLSY